MTEQFIGCIISVEVGGGLGYYQGLVKSVQADKQRITLTNVFHNGKLIKAKEVTISAEAILDLKILHGKEDEKELKEESVDSKLKKNVISNSIPDNKPTISTDGTSSQKLKEAHNYSSLVKESDHKSSFKPVKNTNLQNKKEEIVDINIKPRSRTYVSENLAHMSLNTSSNDRNNYDRIGSNYEYSQQRRNMDSSLSKTPNKRHQWKNYRDERNDRTFGTPIDEDIYTDFDFEKNLALFDKQAIMEEIQSLKPDVVRQADRKSERKYRCDENVLSTKTLFSPKTRQIIVPAADSGEVIYTTDDGLLIPSVTPELRLNLLSTASQHGLTKSRQLEMMGRAATEIILSVIGGSHRLEPGNSHQAPVVVLLCGANMQGAAGTNCGRQLESQGVRTVITVPPLAMSSPSLLLSQEIQLYSMTSGRLGSNPAELPSTVDLIVDARYDLAGLIGVEAHDWVTSINSWALASRAPIVALDPPPSLSNNTLVPRIRLCPSLPLAYPPENGKVYLLNLNIPQQIFSSLKINYTSPFGAKMVIPLHPCD